MFSIRGAFAPRRSLAMSQDVAAPPRGLPQVSTIKHPTTHKIALPNKVLRLRKPNLYGCIL